jgi:hypothetical protein
VSSHFFFENDQSVQRGLRRDTEALKKRYLLSSDAGPNHWVEASGGFNIASDGSAPSSPTPIGIDIAIARQSVGSEDLYFINTSGAVDALTLAKPGGYEIWAVASFPTGLSGYISVTVQIGGDAWSGTNDSAGYEPASFSGTGGGVVRYKLPIEVLSTAVVGTATEVAVFPEVWQSSGSSRVGAATLFVKRLT